MLGYPNDQKPSDGRGVSRDFTGLTAPTNPASSSSCINIDRPAEDTRREAEVITLQRPAELENGLHTCAVRAIPALPSSIGLHALQFTGFRRGNTLISLDAPTQSRMYLSPSATSARDISPATSSASSTKRSLEDNNSSGDVLPTGSHEESLRGLDPEAKAQARLEKRRRKNTVAARRSRARKAEHVQELEEEVQKLREQLSMCEQELMRAGREIEELRLRVLDGQLD